MEKSLNQLKPNEKGIVAKIISEGKTRRRLFDMGLTPGVEILMKKTAPMGDPIEISIRGYELSLRKEEAKTILLSNGGEK